MADVSTRNPDRTEDRTRPPTRDGSTADDEHRIEREVRHELLSHPDFRFSSLVIRRIDSGVCLEGVIETADESPDVASLARRVSGVKNVLNHLVVLPTDCS